MIRIFGFVCFLNIALFADCAGQVIGENVGSAILLRDEGLSQLSYEDFDSPEKSWYVAVPPGRDLQLVGRGRVLIGTGSGYEERDIQTGEKLFSLTSFEGTVTARRLTNGNTLLTRINWRGKEGIVLLEVDSSGSIRREIVYPNYNYVRLVRETSAGTYLITSNTIVFEGNALGEIVWTATLSGPEKQNCWQALRTSNGQTIVSSGYGADIRILDQDGKETSKMTGPPEVNPHFYAGMQILNNGNILVTNWQAHGPGHGTSGIQLLEYNRSGKLVGSWRQNSTRYSSLQGVILLDGLDINYLHIEDEKGVLTPVR